MKLAIKAVAHCATHLRNVAVRLQSRAKLAVQWLRFGDITETIKSFDGGVASEIEYRDSNGKVIGFWAYGHFDPSGPYRG